MLGWDFFWSIHKKFFCKDLKIYSRHQITDYSQLLLVSEQDKDMKKKKDFLYVVKGLIPFTN